MFSFVFNGGDRDSIVRNPTSDLEYVLDHVFFPPNKSHSERKHYRGPRAAMDVFVDPAYAAAYAYYEHVDDFHKPQWYSILQVLSGLRYRRSYGPDESLCQLRGIKPGECCIFSFLYEETAVIFRKQDHCTLYEQFELNPFVDDGAPESVIRSYPELTIEIPNEVFQDESFQSELANFLYCINNRNSESHAEWYKHNARYHPRYTTQLLVGILRTLGRPAEVTHIAKRVVPRVCGLKHTWYRATEWFLVRIAVQSSLNRSLLGRTAYKTFMLFFMLGLANYATNDNLSSNLLHLMSAKILRRFRKLGASVPKWLSDAVVQTCTRLSEVLDERCMQAQIAQRVSLPWNPSQLDLNRDTQFSLARYSKYLSSSLVNREPDPLSALVLHCPIRGTLHHFLSSGGLFFEEAYHRDPHVALYDVEQAVEHGIDDWLACVVDIDEACIQLEVLVEKYLSGVQKTFRIHHDHSSEPSYDPAHISNGLLTIIELWVALDKLAVMKIPILDGYSPEIPLNILDRLLLRRTTNIHRFLRARQYLSARHNQSQPESSVFSHQFTEQSFPVRYFNSSPHLQYLRDCIMGDGLPTNSLDAKAVLFELKCPLSFEAWRSTTIRLLDFCYDWKLFNAKDDNWYPPDSIPITKVPELRRHVVRYHRAFVSLAYSHSRCWGELRYVIDDHHAPRGLPRGRELRCLEDFAYKIQKGPYANSSVQQYFADTSHTSNKVLSAQADCHVDLPLHEFIDFGHMRSGGSLQWMNILRAVRSRALNFRHYEVHLLLAQVSAQLGPFTDIGESIWHQELQDVLFCHALLEELESLLVDVGAGSSDGPVMGTIAILASSLVPGPSEAVSDRTFKLLRNVREKTFSWVDELLYDVIKSPANEERRQVLWDTAAICRSTFDVDPPLMHKLLHSARDIEIALTCSLLMRTLVPIDFPSTDDPSYSRVLLERDHRLSHALERVLRDAIIVDTSGLGVDLAVRKSWLGYRPGTSRWKPLDHPNSHWIVCQTGEPEDQRPRIVHINLLDGSLLVDSKPMGEKLPTAIVKHPVYSTVFGKYNFEVIPSDLPGMDYVTRFTISEHQVHFSLKGDNLIIRARHADTGDVFELIPQKVLHGGLPAVLVNGHAHWLNLSTAVIEIRPLDKLWKQSLDNWRISHEYGVYRMTKRCESIVDIQSPTWNMVSRRLECLDIPDNLIITSSPVNTTQPFPSLQLSAILPRYSLSFFVSGGGDLESRDFKDMVYDENQCVETLFGLINRLVLRPKAQIEEDLVPRYILIPDGEPCIEQHGCHPRIVIDHHEPHKTSCGEKGSHRPSDVPYHIYKMDDTLGCLSGISSLTSRLRLAELHTLTNNACRPDPLTGRTGMEEAISLTWLAGDGCAVGDYDPDHIQDFGGHQTRIAIEKIRGNIIPCFDKNLKDCRHALLQEAYLYPSEIVARLSKEDKVDVPPCKPSLVDDLVHVASIVDQWALDAPSMNDLSDWAEAWGDTVTGNNPVSQLEMLRSSHTLSPLKMRVYNLLGRGKGKNEGEGEGTTRRFQLLFTIPVMVYSSEDRRATLLSTLVAFSKQPNVHSESPLQFAEDNLLDRYHPNPNPMTHTLEPSSGWRITLDHLLHERLAPKLPPYHRLPLKKAKSDGVPSASDATRLDQLFSSLLTGERTSDFQTKYISCLQSSVCHVRDEEIRGGVSSGSTMKHSIKTLREHYVLCKAGYKKSLDIVKKALGPRTQIEQILDRCGQWPRATPYTLFRCLASTSPIKPPQSWKECLISLSLFALELQRARRLLQFMLNNLEDEFLRELENEGGDGWLATEHPDWLLLQLQGNFLIRRTQVEIAKEMIAPRLKENTTFQVNLGEGKSSVIVPICAAALANSCQLVRVIVPKALKTQMLRILADRLGGLVGMSVHDLTLSRFRYPYVDVIRNAMAKRAIFVTSPEDTLALRLTCVDAMVDNKVAVNPPSMAQRLEYEHLLAELWLKSITENTYVATVFGRMKDWLRDTPSQKLTEGGNANNEEHELKKCREELKKLQSFFFSHARDILDESDEILHPRFQMIYTFGLPQHVGAFPERWTITQQVLRLVNRHASSLSILIPQEIGCERSTFGSFPRICILQVNSEKRFIPLIAEDVVRGRLVDLGVQYLPQELQDAIYEFISLKDILPETAKMVEQYAQELTNWGALLLLRGLLADNILLFALAQRRWRVDYGLDPTRTMLAVPYRAKDVPASKAEFGHPDLTIVLTCLSYYYGGLSEEQLRMSFEILLEQDDPFSDYAIWLEGCASGPLLDAVRDLSAINIRSSEQWERYLVPMFSRNQGAIDFYLSRLVFPKHAKEYPWKISGSSWDIAERKNHHTTGFSGTSDAQYLLPTSIRQDDPDYLHQTGTNARVLANILHPDNSHYIVTAHENSERWTTVELLRTIVTQEPEIRVLLDVGAQILDLSNHELAETWLDLTVSSHAAGAIYIDERDELVVLTRNGIVQPLHSSPLAQQLDRCVAYLDDIHTRGTDIKFPRGFRAAVTLGAKVTKDRLVQGCMRMRKLGHGHSVMFFAPPEVDARIRTQAVTSNDAQAVTTADILRWAIQETWGDIERWAPHWAQQGMTHKSQNEALSRFLREEITSEQLATSWVQPETKSLADLYAPRHQPNTTRSMELDVGIRQRCKILGVSSLPDARLDEEQEREVSREVERERETERPPEAEPAEHYLHPDVVEFVRTGVLRFQPESTAFCPVFTTLANSSAGPGEPRVWSPYILATADFCKTIVEGGSFQGRIDQYLRPIQWVLSGKKDGNDALVVLSPFEADRLMPHIRLSEHVHLHLYAPCTTERMKPCDDLRLYSIPPLPSDWTPPWALIDQLNVFAGQLYLRDYTSYVRLCRFVGVHTENLPRDGPNVPVLRNWFDLPGSLEPEIEITFDRSPLPFVMMLLAIRRKGMGFAKTHMGSILRGRLLTEKDFEDPAPPVVHYGFPTATDWEM